MSNYRQQYGVPYSGGVSAGGPGNTLSDNFDQSRPAFKLFAEGTDVPGLASIDPKWKKLSIDDVFLRVAAVDTRLQMCLLEGGAVGKGVCGLYQQLPLPAEGETLDLAIYAQSRVAAMYTVPQEDPEAQQQVLSGIFIADDLVTAPTTSSILMVGAGAGYNPGSVAQMVRGATAQLFVAYNALPSGIGQTTNDMAFQRIRLRQQLDGGLWNINVALEVGNYGADWLPLGYFDAVGADAPFKSVGFGLTSLVEGGVGQLQLDNFIVNVEDYGPGYSGVMGGIQQLGAV